MREFTDSIVESPEGYKAAIVTLEAMYGGTRKLIGARQQALFTLPVLTESNFAVLEAMHARLSTFLARVGGVGRRIHLMKEKRTPSSTMLMKSNRRTAAEAIFGVGAGQG